MEWVNAIDNAVEKIKKDGRDPDATEILNLKEFVNSNEGHLKPMMHVICNEFVVDDDMEVNFPFWLIQGYVRCWFRFHSNGRTVPTTGGGARTGTDSGFSRLLRRTTSTSLPTSRAPFCQVTLSHDLDSTRLVTIPSFGRWLGRLPSKNIGCKNVWSVCFQRGLAVRWLGSSNRMQLGSSPRSAW